MACEGVAGGFRGFAFFFIAGLGASGCALEFIAEFDDCCAPEARAGVFAAWVVGG